MIGHTFKLNIDIDLLRLINGLFMEWKLTTNAALQIQYRNVIRICCMQMTLKC